MKNYDYLCARNKPKSAETMNIKEKIKACGKSQVEIAELLGMSKQNLNIQIGNLENNTAVNLLQNIARELNMSVSELIDDPLARPQQIDINFGGETITYVKKKED